MTAVPSEQEPRSQDREQAGSTSIADPGIDLDVRLRVGLVEDAVQLAEVFVAAWRQSYRGVVAESILRGLDENEIAGWLRTLLRQGVWTTNVAEARSHELLGFCRYGVDPDDADNGHIFSLYVLPAASGRGIGGQLLAQALRDLDRRHLGPVTLWVFERNETARRFYTGFNFRPDGGRRIEAEYGAQEVRLSRAAGTAP
jgi:ribosomal protein S18 acetylase RimI-like enzyme